MCSTFSILCGFSYWPACCDSCRIGKLLNRLETKGRISEISPFFWRPTSSALSLKPVFENPKLYTTSVIHWVGLPLPCPLYECGRGWKPAKILFLLFCFVFCFADIIKCLAVIWFDGSWSDLEWRVNKGVVYNKRDCLVVGVSLSCVFPFFPPPLIYCSLTVIHSSSLPHL